MLCYGVHSMQGKTNDPILRKFSDGWTDRPTRMISLDAVLLTLSTQECISFCKNEHLS